MKAIDNKELIIALEELEKVSIDDLIGNIEIVPSNQIAILKNSSKNHFKFFDLFINESGNK